MPTQGYAPPAAHYPPPPGYGPAPGYPPLPPGYRPVPVSPSGQPLASFADRLLAYLIDAAVAVVASMVLVIPAVILMLIIIIPDTRPDGTVANPTGASILLLLLIEAVLFLVMIGLTYLYYVEWLIRHDGQTVGKKAMKLRVVPLDPAVKLTRGLAAKRWLATQGCAIVPGLGYLDGLWQLWDKPHQQCLHDKWPRTTVIKVPG